MFELIKLLFDICLLKKGPQDLPYSTNVLKIVAITDIFANFLLSNIKLYWFAALIKAALTALLIAGFVWICLSFAHKKARFYQTTTALIGADALIRIIALPAIATISISQGGILGFLVMIALIIWYWRVTGHIMRNALEQSTSFSLGLAFLYLLLLSQITALVVG